MSGMDRLTELLPCPFCGGAPTLALGRGAYGVNCRCKGEAFIQTYGGGFVTTGFTREQAKENAIAAWNRRASQAAPAHEDDLAVDRFGAVMKAKLAKKRDDGRGGWSGPECSEETLSHMLRDHVVKGDPVDVANFAMMLHQRGDRIAQAAPAPSDALRKARKEIAALTRWSPKGLPKNRGGVCMGVGKHGDWISRKEVLAALSTPTEEEAQFLDDTTRAVLDRAERIVAGQSQQEQRAAEIFLRPTEEKDNA